jgi:hypothetical protein
MEMTFRKKRTPPPSRLSRLASRVSRKKPEPARSRAIVAWLTRGRVPAAPR